MVRKAGAFVGEPVSFLRSKVSTPLAYLNISFQQASMNDGFRKLVPYAGILHGACGGVFIGSIGKG